MKILTGYVANPGKFTGKAKKISSPEGIEKIKEGDILITNNNSPLLSIAFMKASAIISEKGGSLCHLAIVARELNKPCIMGVLDALNQIPEGALIELDATNNKIVVFEDG